MSFLGTALLAGSLAAALAGVLLWARVARHPERAGWPAHAARTAGVASLACVLAAVVVMEAALLAGGTSLDYPATVTEQDVPAYYRFTALWSAMEGSLMLWLFTLAAVATLFLIRHGRTGDDAVAHLVLWLLVAAFGVVVLVAHPFSTGGALGGSPSPLLQDHPAMGIHPPLLYLGFAGLAVPFALAFTAFRQGSSVSHWAGSMYAWTVGAWIPLTAGIFLGAWWSYAVLGWGGYWAWDPVENASLMPWLLATALLHSVAPRTRTPNWRSWSVILAGAAFTFVLLATFLTRSGVVQSIHAFSTSPLGPLLLVIVVVAAAAWLIFLFRATRVAGRTRATATSLDRRGAVLLNRVLLLLVTGIVLVGSLLPTVLEALTGDRMSVGAPWYARSLGPFAFLLLLAMAVAPLLPWRGRDRNQTLRLLRAPGVGCGVAVAIIAFTTRDPWLALIGGLAVFVVVTLVRGLLARAHRNRRAVGALLAHLGVALGAVAVAAGSHGSTIEQTVLIGETAGTGGVSVTLVTVDRIDDGHRSIAEAEVLLGDGARSLGVLHPQLRWYERQGAVLAGPAIRTEPFRDVYVTLLNVDPVEGSASLRLTVSPLISWLWFAGVLMIGGATVAFAGGTRAPVRRQPPAGKPRPVGSLRS